MRIVHVLNLANDAFSIVKPLRKQGIDADLIIKSDDFGMGLPMWEELEIDMDPYSFDLKTALKEYDLPEWMRVWWVDNESPMHSVLSLFRMVKGYDLLHLHSISPMYLQFACKQFIIHEAGWIRRLVTRDSGEERLGRRAYSYAACVVMTNPDTYALLRMLKYREAVFIPFVIDTEQYKPMSVEKTEDLLFFHPARHVWDVKGNDKLLKAFRAFIESGYKAKLRLVDWGYSEDVSKARAFLRKSKLNKYVEWVSPYSKPALRRAYSEVDVVFDQFVLGSGGTTCYEAMACEVPVVIHLNEWNRECFGEMPPVVEARTIEDIYEAMVLLSDQQVRKRVGAKERDFVLKHNHPDVVAGQLTNLYERILS
ncbi:MAG: glycosyltransferase family 4 protein [Candidatus Bathyarchaeota archaeon]|nr:MAG: glycosyltransferase family 4 protein [Candidatus Bathyarchaeota archaeon]